MMHAAGIEHVLAISGFHFGAVAALIVFCVQGASPLFRTIFSMLFLTGYLVAIGPLPSVVRAYTAAMCCLFALLIHKRVTSLNCFGFALLVSSLLDPESLISLGYQLSFLATLAILLFSPFFFSVFSALVPSRPLQALVHFSFQDQILFSLLRWILTPLTLLFSVFVVLIPYQLSFLPDFSLFGFFYNLFIPALFSLAMPMILIALLFSFWPLGASLFSFLAEIPLKAGLFFIMHRPEPSWAMCEGAILPEAVGRLVLLLLFLVGISIYRQKDEDYADLWKACL
jgi:competence protein ComEC